MFQIRKEKYCCAFCYETTMIDTSFIFFLCQNNRITRTRKISKHKITEIRKTQLRIRPLGNKRNRNLPAETRNLPKPKFGTGFVPAHFQASWFRFRYLVLKFWNFLVNQEVPAQIPGLTRKFLVKPGIRAGTSWFTRKFQNFKTRYRNRNREA